MNSSSTLLADCAPDLEHVLTHNAIDTPARFAVSDIQYKTVWMTTRDGVRLATDLYLPPLGKAPAVAVRTPYGRSMDSFVNVFASLARRGYVVVAQDCRGTGESEPDFWDYYMYEPEDGLDLVEWVSRQEWFDGFLAAFGGSYVAQTQWSMSVHPRMSTIVPLVSGLGVAINTVHSYMFSNAYALVFGKGEGRVPIHYTKMERYFEKETMAGGYFNESLHQEVSAALQTRYPELRALSPAQAKRWLWEKYCSLSCAERARFVKEALGVKNITTVNVELLPSIFGHQISHDAHTIPHPNKEEMCQQLRAPALMITGWYDWGLNDALATWELLTRVARESVRSHSRLIITPSAHGMPGYYEGIERHPELLNSHRYNVELLLRWYGHMREGSVQNWPSVIYYLMGANEWRVSERWPPPEAREIRFHLGADRTLTTEPPCGFPEPDSYIYDPAHPTPTVGGSIVSYLYPPGSADVSEVQKRLDVLTYTTPILQRDLDVVGPLRLVLYASSSAVDTDFSARLSDVFPDGRAIQLQSAMLRARYRDLRGEPALLEAGRIYQFDIDLWATANRFKVGHRLRLDISSADFPRFDRNTNRGGNSGPPLGATQTIYHDAQHPSHLVVCSLEAA